MGSPKMLSGFVKILREAYKIFLRNGKLIPYITLLFLFLTYVPLLSNIFSIKPVLTGFIVKLSTLLLSPTASDVANNLIFPVKYDLRIFAATEWIFILFYKTYLDLGYGFFVSVVVFPLVMIFDQEIIISSFSILVFIIAAILYFYLAVVWTLASVVSVVEEKNGSTALDMAGETTESSTS